MQRVKVVVDGTSGVYELDLSYSERERSNPLPWPRYRGVQMKWTGWKDGGVAGAKLVGSVVSYPLGFTGADDRIIVASFPGGEFVGTAGAVPRPEDFLPREHQTPFTWDELRATPELGRSAVEGAVQRVCGMIDRLLATGWDGLAREHASGSAGAAASGSQEG